MYEAATHSALDPHDTLLVTHSTAATCKFCRVCLHELNTVRKHQHSALITPFWVLPRAAERAIFGSINEHRIMTGAAFADDDRGSQVPLLPANESEADRDRRAPLGHGADGSRRWLSATTSLARYTRFYEMWPKPIRAHARI